MKKYHVSYSNSIYFTMAIFLLFYFIIAIPMIIFLPNNFGFYVLIPGSVFLIVFICAIGNNFRSKRILRDGVDSLAVVTKLTRTTSSNTGTSHSITYEYENENGIHYLSELTVSEEVFDLLKNGEIIPIKFYHNRAIFDEETYRVKNGLSRVKVKKYRVTVSGIIFVLFPFFVGMPSAMTYFIVKNVGPYGYFVLILVGFFLALFLAMFVWYFKVKNVIRTGASSTAVVNKLLSGNGYTLIYDYEAVNGKLYRAECRVRRETFDLLYQGNIIPINIKNTIGVFNEKEFLEKRR